MARDVEQLVVSLEARIRDFERNFERAGRTAEQKFGQIERRARQSGQRLQDALNTSTAGINRALATVGAGVSFAEIARFADAWTEAGNKIRAAAAATGVQVRSLQELKAGANAARVSLEDYVDLYSRMVRSASGVAKTEGEIAKATRITAQAFKAGGASAQEQASGIIQLGQALGSGVLQGDELRSLRENAPILAKAIADSFGVPLAALKRLGEQGKLTSPKVFEAILKAGPEVEKQFKATTETIGDSFTRLKNEFTAYIGTMAQTSGAAATFRSIIDGLSGNIDRVANAAAAAAAVLLTRYVPAMLRAGAAGATMLLTNPFVALAAAAGGAVIAIAAFGDKMKPIEGDLANLQDYASVAWDALKQGAVQAGSAIQNTFQTILDFTSRALSGIGVSWADVGAVIRGTANVLVNSFVFAYDVLAATFGKLPQAIAETVLNAINGLIAAVEAGLNKVVSGVNSAVEAINSVGGKVGVSLGKVGSVELGRIRNGFEGAGTQAANAYIGAIQNATKDRVGTALAGINGASENALAAWRKRANDIAAKRGETEKAKAAADKASADAAKSAQIKGGAKTMPLELTKQFDDTAKRLAGIQAEVALRKSIVGTVEQVEAAVERQKMAQQLVNEAVKEGVVMNDDAKQKIGALADAYAKAALEAKALAKAQAETADKAREFEGASKDAAKGFIKDLAAGKNPAEALASAIGKINDKLFDMAFDSLWKTQFGNDPTKTIFGQISAAVSPTKPETTTIPGSALAGVNFDPNKITGTMAVQAGVVNLTTGSIGGLPNPAAPTNGTPAIASPASAVKSPISGDLPRTVDAAKASAPGVDTSALKVHPVQSSPLAPPIQAPVVKTGVQSNARVATLNQPAPIPPAPGQSVRPDGLPSQFTGMPTIQGAGGNWMTKIYTQDGKAYTVDMVSAGKLQKQIVDLEKQGYKIKPAGGYNWREVRGYEGTGKMSNHAYGKAIDMNPDENPLTKGPLITDMPANTSAMAKANGLRWGGDYARRKDAMHFEDLDKTMLTGSREEAIAYAKANYGRQAAAATASIPSTTLPPASQASEQAMQAQLEAQRRLQEQMQASTQAVSTAAQPMQGLQQAAMQATPNLSGMAQGVTGLVGPLAQAVPGLGQFGGAISGLVGQLAQGVPGMGMGMFGGLGFADGGAVTGPGTSTSDSIPAMLSDGEFVVNAKATKTHRGVLEAINSGKAPRFAVGGFASRSSFSNANTYAPILNIDARGGDREAAGRIAAATGKVLDQRQPDTFRRSPSQQASKARDAMAGAG